MKAMSELTRKEALALLATLYHELEAVFKCLKKAHVSDADEVKALILEKLKYLISTGYKLDLQDQSIYDVFTSELEI